MPPMISDGRTFGVCARCRIVRARVSRAASALFTLRIVCDKCERLERQRARAHARSRRRLERSGQRLRVNAPSTAAAAVVDG